MAPAQRVEEDGMITNDRIKLLVERNVQALVAANRRKVKEKAS